MLVRLVRNKAAGKGPGADKLDDPERTKLRGQALDWLRADLVARRKVLSKDPFAAVTIQQQLKYWQTDADLASVRDDKQLAKLPEAEQKDWQKLWSDVNQLLKEARSTYTETALKGTLTANERQQVHELKMTAGKTCVIDMSSAQFDTYLRLEEADKKKLAENDDIAKDNQNSRLVFTPKEDAIYRIIATAFEQRAVGAYSLVIREFTAGQTKRKEEKP